MNVSPTERDGVRELARRVAELAALPVQEEKAEMWRRHNALERVRPMVLIFPEGSWREIMRDWTWTCEDETCRWLERELRQRLYCWEHLRDDRPIAATVLCPIVVHHSGCGLAAVNTRPAEEAGAYHIDPVLKEERDIEKLRIPEVRVDWEASARKLETVRELLDGILPVALTHGWGGHTGWAPLDQLIQWRGIDRLFEDLMDRPEWVHRVLQRMLDIRMAEIDQFEAQGALFLNNGQHYNGSGGVGYTRELPQPDFDGEHVRPQDLWAMATAQIFVSVSPAMHEEFALRYERQFLERFGLTSYGCCEPLHHKLDYVKRIRNLRRVSISPWADIDRSAEGLGDRYVFSWKPNPAIVAAPTWQPDEVRRVLVDFCERTRGCITDIIMKDTHTCRQEPERLSDWVRLALEVAEAYG